jgi:hypothetical protein
MPKYTFYYNDEPYTLTISEEDYIEDILPERNNTAGYTEVTLYNKVKDKYGKDIRLEEDKENHRIVIRIHNPEEMYYIYGDEHIPLPLTKLSTGGKKSKKNRKGKSKKNRKRNSKRRKI